MVNQSTFGSPLPMIDIEEFVPDIMAEVANCPVPVIERRLREAAIEACERAPLVRWQAKEIPTAADRIYYDIPTPSTQLGVHSILRCYVAGTPLANVPAIETSDNVYNQINRSGTQGYLVPNRGSIQLNGTPQTSSPGSVTTVPPYDYTMVYDSGNDRFRFIAVDAVNVGTTFDPGAGPVPLIRVLIPDVTYTTPGSALVVPLEEGAGNTFFENLRENDVGFPLINNDDANWVAGDVLVMEWLQADSAMTPNSYEQPVTTTPTREIRGLDLFVTLKPVRNCDELPKVLYDDYYNLIISGTLGGLFGMNDTSWHDASKEQRREEEFEFEIAKAKQQIDRGMTTKPLKLRPRRFV